MRHAAALLMTVLLAVGCYGLHRVRGPDGGADASGDGPPPIADAGAWPDSGAWWPDASALPDVGPICPDAGSGVTSYECDVLEQTGCEPGLACYGWIEQTTDPCQSEVYRAACLTPGPGGQGDPCDAWCGAGLECFVTGEGTQCLHVCAILGGEPRCPPGLICRPTDMPGIGACH